MDILLAAMAEQLVTKVASTKRRQATSPLSEDRWQDNHALDIAFALIEGFEGVWADFPEEDFWGVIRVRRFRGFDFSQDGDVGVGVFPESEEILTRGGDLAVSPCNA